MLSEPCGPSWLFWIRVMRCLILLHHLTVIECMCVCVYGFGEEDDQREVENILVRVVPRHAKSRE